MSTPDTLPPILSGAARMLRSAYPGGMPDTAYFAVLALLYDHFSDRNLAELMAAVTHKDAETVLNDIYACASSQPEPSSVEAAKNLLAQHGLQAVCAED
ncbi:MULTISPECIES: DUF3349 domain-containing protein [Janthinobacterium]|uniref:DUF3349 domain-containing protein n=1 Tax=Janthinobacterium TaxID=29580 RepID=UPI000893282C|nr:MULTISPECIES: DUF3349 domain-containing protein [Janthinobacterium]MCC7717306.1 DUF3349 domain-containing protein [Janthinobacterium lividum]MDO8037386.1 DUF3349 domain-containing protein [Janthinobacterium sp. SUN128]OEZ49829.1 hypothetical protein JANLI_53580 [Janthinobacterium lividum]WQE29400.1 DUF3349 domain-containing protein [Janthinobacterium lividum]STQ94878.1 Protein of uncharacterised function (DUF3349) [Janthinobacterium lividum]